MAALDMARQKLNDDQQKYNDLRSDLDSMLKEVESPDNDVEEIVKLRVIHEQVMHELDTQAPRRMELSVRSWLHKPHLSKLRTQLTRMYQIRIS